MDDSPESETPPFLLDGDGEEDAKPSAAELEAAGQSALFGAPAEPDAQPIAESAVQAPASSSPVASAAVVPAPNQPYRVLARKYRPQTFSELIGQEPMVQTLGNAILRERLAHAFLMTGVRGVGKTSTARLIAKALNCVGPDGQGGPTIDPCGKCEPCTAIAEGRHIDVIEMDAASHTGIDDVREIIEAVRYAAVSARYKMYIIDEAHMLSKQAWNGLLKTLEEPPAHVKFLFATTEVDKVPITVLSRTQRFDLRRIPADLLREHYASICRQEGVEADEEALALVAAAAEGSVRDGLSILDQAIAHADMDSGADASGGLTRVTAERVRDMLGLADHTARAEMFSHLLEGDPQALLAAVENQYALGVDPLALMRAMMELTHRIAVSQVGRSEPDAASAEERARLGEWAQRLSAGQVHRLWQLLLKGYEEVRAAPDPLVAAQMALLRVLHAAELPDPGKLAKQLEEMAASGAIARASGGGNGPGGAPNAALDWAALVDQIDHSTLSNAMSLATKLRLQVRVIELVQGRLVFAQPDGFEENIAPEIRQALQAITGSSWQVEKGEGAAKPTLVEQAEAAKAAEADRLRRHPLVEKAFAVFPNAQIIEEEAPSSSQHSWRNRA